MAIRSRSCRRFTIVCAVWLTLAMSTGCWGDDSDGECVLRGLPCDIRESSCQDAVYRATACVAEMDAGRRPSIRTIPLSALEDELRTRVAEEPEDETEAGWNAALRLLGLLSETTDSTEASVNAAVENLLAFYDNETKQVTVIDRNAGGDPGEDLFTLSHELVHALRDAQSDLGRFRELHATSTDSAEAVSSLAEGEAVVVAAALVRQVAQGRGSAIDWGSVGAALDESALARIAAADEPFVIALQNLPYVYGTRRIGPEWSDSGRAVIDDLYAHPDLSLLNWTAPLGERRDVEPLECFPTAPPDGYVGEDSDSFGLTAVLALPIALGEDAESAALASWHWRDDRVVVFRPADDSTSPERAVAWRIRFDSAQRAAAFGAAVGVLFPDDAQISTDEEELLILAATGSAAMQGWTHARDCGREEDLPVAAGDAMDAMMDGRLSPRLNRRPAPRAPRPRRTRRSRRRTRARRLRRARARDC